MTKTENKNDDKLFEFLNSNPPASKERKPVKPKIVTDSSSEVAIKPSDSVEKLQGDVADGRINEGEVSADSWSSKCKISFLIAVAVVGLRVKKIHAHVRL